LFSPSVWMIYYPCICIGVLLVVVVVPASCGLDVFFVS
jgi:hypothetical protein